MNKEIEFMFVRSLAEMQERKQKNQIGIDIKIRYGKDFKAIADMLRSLANEFDQHAPAADEAQKEIFTPFYPLEGAVFGADGCVGKWSHANEKI